MKLMQDTRVLLCGMRAMGVEIGESPVCPEV